MIRQALDDEVFPRISIVGTTYDAWKILKKEYIGDTKVISVKLQTLHCNFETLIMQEK